MERKRKRTAEMLSKEVQSTSKRFRNERSHKNVPLIIPKKEKEMAEEVILEIKVEENEVNQCRGCRTEGVHGLFSIHEEGLKDLFSLLTGIEIKDDDPAPNFLCEFCRSQLMNFSLFRTTCIESNSYFIEKMNEKLLAVETKREIFVDTMPIISEEKTEDNSSGKNLVQCNECSRVMLRNQFLWHWLYTHSVDAKPSTCGKCKSQFPSKYHLENHQRTLHGIMKCFNCKLDYTDPTNVRRAGDNLRRHIRRCNNLDEYKEARIVKPRRGRKKPVVLPKLKPVEKYQCNECLQEMPRSHFISHWRYNHLADRKPSTCGKCQLVFPSCYKLEKHQRVVHGLLKCCICDRVYAESSRNRQDVSNLIRHIRRCDNFDEYKVSRAERGEKSRPSGRPLSPQPEVDRLTCKDCDKEMPRKVFDWHWRYEHHVDEQHSTCSVCQQEFPSVYKLETHQRTDHGLLKCILCNREPLYSKDPRDISTFFNHLKLHYADLAGEEVMDEPEPLPDPEKITCNECKKAFQKPALLLHWRYKHAVDAKKSFCGECEQYFPSIYKLERHRRKEHDILQCYKCDRCYTNHYNKSQAKANLSRHIRRCDGYEEYTQKRIRKLKVKSKSTEGRITCTECGQSIYHAHLKRHWNYNHLVDERPSICGECGKVLPSCYQLEDHQWKKHGILQCFKCDRIPTIHSKDPKDRRYYKEHLRTCSGKKKKSKIVERNDPIVVKEEPKEKPVKKPELSNKDVIILEQVTCNECNFSFYRREFLKHWRYTHLIDEKPSFCSECSEEFQSEYKLEEHQRTEHGILKCFKCTDRPVEYCTNPLNVRVFLNHLMKCNKDPYEDPFECKYCGNRFVEHYRLVAHEETCFKQVLVCHICGIHVKKSNLKLHIERHSTARNHKCRTCGKGFPTAKQRKEHENHACNIENVICDYCGRTCKNKYRLRSHIRHSHMNTDPNSDQQKVQCTICGVIVSYIHSHMVIHRVDRKFSCKVEGCSASFKRAPQLKKHAYTHSKKRPYNCTLCEIGYYNTDYLRGHYKRDHGVDYPKGKKVPLRKL